MKSVAMFLGMCAMVATGSVAANELLLTEAKSRGNQAFALDLASDGGATALQIRIDVADGAKADLSKCLSGLPKTHTGVCAMSGKRITILVHSDQNAMLPAGLVSIGSVTLSGGVAENLKLVELMAFDASGEEIKISSQNSEGFAAKSAEGVNN